MAMARPAEGDRLARYEAVLALYGRLRAETTLEGLAAAVAEQWRYCASVQSWRLLARMGGRFVVIDGDAASSSVRTCDSSGLDAADLAHWRARRPRVYSGPEVAGAEPALPAHLRNSPIREVAAMPFGGGAGRWGCFLYASTLEPRFSNLDIKFVRLVGTFLCAEIEALRRRDILTRTLRRQASRDGLTGLANRRHFEERFETEWRDAARSARPLAMLMIDVDKFKEFNDRFGHVGGDECLKAVASEIRRAAQRPRDLAGRVGGEEFAVVLPDTSANGASAIAGLLQTPLRARGAAFSVGGVDAHFTLSIGVATMIPGRDEERVTLKRAADDALYAAKRSGRDRVSIAPRQMADAGASPKREGSIR